ncbi:ABC transporter G family member 24 [Hibiscus syriacus]|uniref:ABC transporter G family member 24 n=1 Tax=Hibiscus syriacus TaxID=106335 RepID=A0A6A2X383_HIBSY|nr:ABC transporter G family member 24 [Hibiscus syriacus]
MHSSNERYAFGLGFLEDRIGEYHEACLHGSGGENLHRYVFFRNASVLRPNRNCNLTSWVSGCDPRWACSVGLNETVDIENSKVIPSRTTDCQPCCAGFLCPRSLTCMIPCPLDSHCPQATLNTNTSLCEPYNYQLPPGKPNHTCGGTNLWADIRTSREVFCPVGSYCPSTVQERPCSSGHYYRNGSTSEKRCFKLTSCDSHTLIQDLHAYGVMLIAAIVTLLLIIYNCSDQVLNMRERQLANTREAAARSARERAKAREGRKADKNAATKLASGLQTLLQASLYLRLHHPRYNQSSQTIQCRPNYEGKTASQIFKYASAQIEKEKAQQQDDKNLTFSGVVSMATDPEMRKRPLIEVSFKDLMLTLKGKDKHLLSGRESMVQCKVQTVRDSLVGTVEKRGISGGQRKRVNVSLEMVMEPSLLILDEPTSVYCVTGIGYAFAIFFQPGPAQLILSPTNPMAALGFSASSSAFPSLSSKPKRPTTLFKVLPLLRFTPFPDLGYVIVAKSRKVMYIGAELRFFIINGVTVVRSVAAAAEDVAGFYEMVSGTECKYCMLGGKGGIGKTSCAASLVVKFANNGHPSLVVSTDPAHSLSDYFAQDLTGGMLVPVEGPDFPLFALEINPEKTREEFRDAAKNNGGTGVKDFMDGMGLGMLAEQLGELKSGELLDTPPSGLDEVIAISKVMQFLESPHYSMFTRIVFYTAPTVTGHTLRLLSLPDFLDASIGKILKLRQKITSATSAIKYAFGQGETPRNAADKLEQLRERMVQVKDLFRDTDSTEFVIVSIPTVMEIGESSRLRASLKKNVPVRRLIVNQILPPSASDCKFCAVKRKDQMRALDMIRYDPDISSLKVIQSPLVDMEIRGVPALKFMGDIIWK